MKPIPFLTPRLPPPSLVARDYEEIFASGTFTNIGPIEGRFATEVSKWIGSDVGVSITASATVGLQLACRALFHADRRLVAVASFTAVSGPGAVMWSGFEPVLIDVEPGSWQPDIAMTERVLREYAGQVAGILLTNTFGTPNVAIDEWEDLARRHGVPLVVDSAAGFGARYPWGEPLGARGDCEVFSFHATKTMAIGEGGAVTSRDLDVIEQLDHLKNFGFDAERRSLYLGLNGKLPELGSAMGIRQLEVLADRIDCRREVFSWYVDALQPLGCEFQSGASSACPPFLSVALGTSRQRDQVGNSLTDAAIGWRTYYNPPVHRHPSFRDVRIAEDLPTTEDLCSRIISLPLDEHLSPCDISQIADVVEQAVER